MYYTMSQYKKFLNLNTNVLMSESLETLFKIILNNVCQVKKYSFFNEKQIFVDITNNDKLGKCFINYIYGELEFLKSLIVSVRDEIPDILNAIYVWRISLSENENTD